MAISAFAMQLSATPLQSPLLAAVVVPSIDLSPSTVAETLAPKSLLQEDTLPIQSAPTEAVISTTDQRLQTSLRLLPTLPNMTQLQQLLPNWSLLDEFGRSLLPVAEDLLTDVEKKALNLTRCRFLNAQHAELNYGLIEPRQAAATTGINVHVICPLGQSFGLIPAMNNQPVDAYRIPSSRSEQPSMKIKLLDISGRPIQDVTYSGTGRVETVQLIGLLQPSDGNTALPAGEVRLPAGSSVLIRLP